MCILDDYHAEQLLQRERLRPAPTPTPSDVLHDETTSVTLDSAPLPPDAFALADVELCRAIAREFRDLDRRSVSAECWELLARKIENVLVGEYSMFSSVDGQLVKSLHLAVLKEPLEAGAKVRSKSLSRLGILVLQAERGQLAQLRGTR